MLVINSAVCYMLAFLLTTVLHEFGHAIVGSLLGSSPVLHHNYVEHLDRASLPVMHQAWIACAGPLVSLAQGLLLLPVVRRRSGGPFVFTAAGSRWPPLPMYRHGWRACTGQPYSRKYNGR